MSKAQLYKFLRALLATILAGLATWILAQMGIHVSVPQVQGH